MIKALILELLAIEYLVIGAPYSSFLSAYDQLAGHQFLVLLVLIIIGNFKMGLWFVLLRSLINSSKWLLSKSGSPDASIYKLPSFISFKDVLRV